MIIKICNFNNNELTHNLVNPLNTNSCLLKNDLSVLYALKLTIKI